MASDIDVLSLTGDLPEVDYRPGEVVINGGSRTNSIWILAAGSVEVRRGDQVISVIDRAGTTFGEISVLLDQPHGASVVALTPVRMRLAVDGALLFERHPEFARLVATGLAQRLDALSVYLADLQSQYGGAPGMSMVADVLRHVSEQPPEGARPVSAREPNPLD